MFIFKQGGMILAYPFTLATSVTLPSAQERGQNNKENARAGGQRARETQGRVRREKGVKGGELHPEILIIFPPKH